MTSPKFLAYYRRCTRIRPCIWYFRSTLIKSNITLFISQTKYHYNICFISIKQWCIRNKTVDELYEQKNQKIKTKKSNFLKDHICSRILSHLFKKITIISHVCVLDKITLLIHIFNHGYYFYYLITVLAFAQYVIHTTGK